jgi:hypothetical protein
MYGSHIKTLSVNVPVKANNYRTYKNPMNTVQNKSTGTGNRSLTISVSDPDPDPHSICLLDPDPHSEFQLLMKLTTKAKKLHII